jgi:hypothetical protein
MFSMPLLLDAVAAVGPEGICACVAQTERGLLDVDPHHRVEPARRGVEGHRGDDRGVGRDILGRPHGQRRLRQVDHGFDKDCVDARGDQALYLPVKAGVEVLRVGVTVRLQQPAAGAATGGNVRPFARGAADGTNRRGIDLLDSLVQAVSGQGRRRGAERVGLEDVGAGLQIERRDLLQEFRAGQVERFGARARLQAALEKHGPHRAVDEQALAILDPLGQWVHLSARPSVP